MQEANLRIDRNQRKKTDRETFFVYAFYKFNKFYDSLKCSFASPTFEKCFINKYLVPVNQFIAL